MIPEPLIDPVTGQAVPYTDDAAALLLVRLPHFSVLRRDDSCTVGWSEPNAPYAYQQAHGPTFIAAVFAAYRHLWHREALTPLFPPAPELPPKRKA